MSVFLLSLFALAVTPVSWLHDALAHHQDVCYHHFDEKGKIITKADINCHCLSFVAEAQFINNGYPSFHLATPAPISSSCIGFYAVHFYSQHHFYSELRGPPSLI